MASSGGIANSCCYDRQKDESETAKKNVKTRLNRIEGQIRGVKNMVDKDTYCDNVINQIASIQSALNGVATLLLEEHVNNCVIEKIQGGDREVVSELLKTVQKLMK